MPVQQGKTFSPADAVKRARFIPPQGGPIEVHFNPESLTLALGATLAPQGAVDGANTRTGEPAASTHMANVLAATLSMRLLFDSTDSGRDVRVDTVRLQRLLRPQSGPEPQIVTFDWNGVFKFKGSLRSYSETIDYFSAEGVPLRASVELSMIENEELPVGGSGADVGSAAAGSASIELGARAGASLSASIGGDALTVRAVAELNGEESLRRLSGSPLEIGGDAQLQGPVAFATASAGIGVSAGAGIGIGGSANASISAGLGLTLSGGASAGLGLGAGIGLSAGLGLSGGLSLSAGLGLSGGLGLGALGLDPSGSASSSASVGPAAAAGAGSGSATSGLSRPGSAAALGASSQASGAARLTAAALAAGAGGAGVALRPTVAGFVLPAGAMAGLAADAARADSAAASFNASVAQPSAVQGPLWGSRASAGVPAVLGAFSGLQVRAAPPRIRRRIDTSKLLPAPLEATLHADEDSAFDIGGRALSTVGAALHADVGARASLTDRIRFDED